MRRKGAPRVPTWEELNGPLPTHPIPWEVEAGLLALRDREAKAETEWSIPSPSSKTVYSG